MRILRTMVVSLGLVLAPLVNAQQTALDDINQRGLALLNAFDERTTTLKGSFVQRVQKPDETTDLSSGTFRLKRPGQFVWEYQTPDEQIIVADGVNLWSYDVLLDQVEVRPQRDALANSPATILSGGGDPLGAFDYQGSFASGDLLWVQLSPKAADSDFGALRIGFRDGVLAGMMLGDSLDQVTEISFEEVEQNIDFDEAAFEFTPPNGVDVYGTPAGVSPPANDVATGEPVPLVDGLG